MNAYSDNYMHNLAKAALRDLHCSVTLGEVFKGDVGEAHMLEQVQRVLAFSSEDIDSLESSLKSSLASSLASILASRPSDRPSEQAVAARSSPSSSRLVRSQLQFPTRVAAVSPTHPTHATHGHAWPQTPPPAAQGDINGENHWDKYMDNPEVQEAARREFEALGLEME
jgi:hypothetical protein